MVKKITSIVIVLMIVLLLSNIIFSNNTGDVIIGKWVTSEGNCHIEIYKSAENIYNGKIIWLKPHSDKNHPETDLKNKDPKLRSRKIIGLDFLSGFIYKGNNVWEQGKIYNPQNGNTYSCILQLRSDGSLKVRGYIGISIIGVTQIWKPLKD